MAGVYGVYIVLVSYILYIADFIPDSCLILKTWRITEFGAFTGSPNLQGLYYPVLLIALPKLCQSFVS
ncbi:hypothetical protein T4D_13350 [Trichinella pseudospiralis]|uniref:Uncharacterized protein n=1 Tax=Trichinella pseudospiralis TaxID=6337 RepID=A0A0V1F5Q1_TRIPS|nr:hypothetical protein T4D_13350 [Trichinella pseudospiralis]